MLILRVVIKMSVSDSKSLYSPYKPPRAKRAVKLSHFFNSIDFSKSCFFFRFNLVSVIRQELMMSISVIF